MSIESNVVQPATQLPEIQSLRGMADSVALLDYMMTCYRVPPSYRLPVPPPSFNNSEYVNYDSHRLIENISNNRTHMVFMLNDSLATDRERELFDKDATLHYLQNFLPKLDHRSILKMTFPTQQMDHKDYVYLIKECDGYYSDLKDFLFFKNEFHRDKFEQYMKEKYGAQA